MYQPQVLSLMKFCKLDTSAEPASGPETTWPASWSLSPVPGPLRKGSGHPYNVA